MMGTYRQGIHHTLVMQGRQLADDPEKDRAKKQQKEADTPPPLSPEDEDENEDEGGWDSDRIDNDALADSEGEEE